MTLSLAPLDGGCPALMQLYPSVSVEIAASGCRLNVQCFLQEEFVMPLEVVQHRGLAPADRVVHLLHVLCDC